MVFKKTFLSLIPSKQSLPFQIIGLRHTVINMILKSTIIVRIVPHEMVISRNRDFNHFIFVSSILVESQLEVAQILNMDSQYGFSYTNKFLIIPDNQIELLKSLYSFKSYVSIFPRKHTRMFYSVHKPQHPKMHQNITQSKKKPFYPNNFLKLIIITFIISFFPFSFQIKIYGKAEDIEDKCLINLKHYF